MTRRPTHEQPPGTSFVYYLDAGGHVTIGHTSQVLARLRALRVPRHRVLALEPGDRHLEHQIHQRFDHLRATRRWPHFHPAAELMAHIAQVHAAHGRPAWLDAPRRGKNGPIEVRRAR